MIDKWDKRFLDVAQLVSTWSKDPSTQCGAVIVSDSHDRRILATGYNGFPRSIADTEERLNNRELKYQLIVHAEMNAILNAAFNGVSVKGSTIYIYGLPMCSDCCKAVVQSGIIRVVMRYPSIMSDKWKDHFKISSLLMNESRVNYDIEIKDEN